jgi:hypothetical protein
MMLNCLVRYAEFDDINNMWIVSVLSEGSGGSMS